MSMVREDGTCGRHDMCHDAAPYRHARACAPPLSRGDASPTSGLVGIRLVACPPSVPVRPLNRGADALHSNCSVTRPRPSPPRIPSWRETGTADTVLDIASPAYLARCAANDVGGMSGCFCPTSVCQSARGGRGGADVTLVPWTCATAENVGQGAERIRKAPPIAVSRSRRARGEVWQGGFDCGAARVRDGAGRCKQARLITTLLGESRRARLRSAQVALLANPLRISFRTRQVTLSLVVDGVDRGEHTNGCWSTKSQSAGRDQVV